MAKRAEVEIGGFLAEIELGSQGIVVLTIRGANVNEKLFERFVQSLPTMNFVQFFSARPSP